jgi:biofilm PGA synthesis N-glycosyltransferase PgaC
VLWSYVMVATLAASVLLLVGIDTSAFLPQFSLIPQWWGLALAVTYLLQALVSQSLESRYETGIVRTLFWMIWYPLAFWMITTLTTVVALPRALMRPRKERTTWVSPDRGFR